MVAKIVGLFSESKISTNVSIAGIFELGLMSKIVCIESSELNCGEIDKNWG